MKNLKEKLESVPSPLSGEQEKALIDQWLHVDGERTPFIIMEELAELISAISKHVARPGEDTLLNVAEELADVQIVTRFCKKYFKISEEELGKIRCLKLTQPIPKTCDKEEPHPDNDRTILRYNLMRLCDGIDTLVTMTNSVDIQQQSKIHIPSTKYTNVYWANLSDEEKISRISVLAGLWSLCKEPINRVLRKSGVGQDKPKTEETIRAYLPNIFHRLRLSNIDTALWKVDIDNRPSAYDYTSAELASMSDAISIWAIEINNGSNLDIVNKPLNFFINPMQRWGSALRVLCALTADPAKYQHLYGYYKQIILNILLEVNGCNVQEVNQTLTIVFRNLCGKRPDPDLDLNHQIYEWISHDWPDTVDTSQ